MPFRPGSLLAVTFASFAALGCSGCSSDPEPTNRSTSRTPEDDDAGPGGAADAGGPTDGGTMDGTAPRAPLYGFVGSGNGKIYVYAVDDTTGQWSLERENAAGTNPSFLAFDPSHRRVVAVDEAGGAGVVRSFDLDPSTGALTPKNDKPSGGADPTHVSFDPTHAFVMVANYTGGNMSIYPIDGSTGMLGDPSDAKPSGAKSHWAGTDLGGKHVFVPTLQNDAVRQYTLGVDGKLTDNGSATVPAGSGPRHLAFHPNGKWAYTINELAVNVSTFAYVAGTGVLTHTKTETALPPGQSASGVTGAEIVVHPNGKHVYVSTRGYNSICQLAVSQTDGTLTRMDNRPTGGNQPRSFAIDPEGTLLFAGNQAVGKVVGFKIDATTGALTALPTQIDVASPTFVGLARIP